MVIIAKEYWNDLLKECIVKSNSIPERVYYLITSVKSLQSKIDEEVLAEYLSDEKNVKAVMDEIIYCANIDTNYITQSYSTEDIEDIIKIFYKVKYINDDVVEVEKK